MSATTHEQTRSFASDFGPFGGRIWLNAAHQGPLPRPAVEAAREALQWKVAPHRIADDAFVEIPRRLRDALGRLIGAPAEDVILGNSASYGLQLLANGLPWQPRDEIVVVAGEFPATVFPWFTARRYGATVRQLRLDGELLSADRLASELRPRTRAVALSWVRSLTGHVQELRSLGEVCADAGVHLIVNVTQGLGALPFDVRDLKLAGVSSSGFKWLCGPYATGFAWIRPDVRDSMLPVQSYWLALPDGATLDLNSEGEIEPRAGLGARAHDVFGTANFANFMPWLAAVEYLLEVGIEAIAAHDALLVDMLLSALETRRWEIVSPHADETRSAIVVLRGQSQAQTERAAAALAAAGIDAARRAGAIRLSPHLYNTPSEIERTLEVLAGASV